MKNRTNNSTRPLLLAAGLAAIAAIAAPASAAIIYVNAASAVLGDGSSWTRAMPHLKDALAVAQAGDQVWVATGTYYPDTSGNSPAGTGDRASRFTLVNGVRLLGGFAGTEVTADQRDPALNVTVLSADLGVKGDLNIGDNAYGILYSINTDSNTVLDGFKIRKSNGNGPAEGDANFRRGGGIYMSGSSMVINDCHFDYCTVVLRGGAICMDGGSTPTITKCKFTFAYGWNGGAIQFDSCSPVIEDCTFANGTAGYGAGISANYYSGGRVARSTFTSGHGVNGGAVTTIGFSTTHFDRCLFLANRCEYLNAFQQRWNGGAVNNWCAGTLWTNCVFVGNTTNGNGGAFYDGGPSGTLPTLINCTIYGNYSRDGGAVAADPGHSPNIKNTIVWANTNSGGSASLFGNVVVEHSNVQGIVAAGAGNMNVEPQFVSPLGNDGSPATGDEDFSLFGTSLLIDAGDSSLLPPTVTLDYEGNARVVDGNGDDLAVVDLGAFEFAPPPPPACIGDANGDRVVNFADITNILTNWGGPGPEGDSDTSGIVNFADITATLTNWGVDCN
jgi:hypothetical protein